MNSKGRCKNFTSSAHVQTRRAGDPLEFVVKQCVSTKILDRKGHSNGAMICTNHQQNINTLSGNLT